VRKRRKGRGRGESEGTYKKKGKKRPWACLYTGGVGRGREKSEPHGEKHEEVWNGTDELVADKKKEKKIKKRKKGNSIIGL